jgi:hypothetical protein
MVAFVRVACPRAGDAVCTGWLVGRHVTAAAGRVAGDGMKSRQGRIRVTARARWGCGDPLGTMRTMASCAAADNGRVDSGRLALVARGARGRGLTRVRVVALLAPLMARGRARLFFRVTRPARRRLRGRMRDGCSVTRGAHLVSRVRHHEGRLSCVARCAESPFFERRERVRLVAPFARDASRMGAGVDSGDLRMTARAARRN